MLLWVGFGVCAAVILFAGGRLSLYGDILAEKTGLGRTLIGLILMAAVTSLPEVATGASAILIYDVPDIAAGDLLGSCMFNLLILSMLDVRDPVPLTARIHQGHVLSAGFGIVLLGIALLGLQGGASVPALAWIGVPSLTLLGIYVVAMRSVLHHERARIETMARELTEEQYAGTPLARALTQYGLNAAALIAAAAFLPGLADAIAARTGLGDTFVGSLLVAASTSMPEVVVSIAAARLGAVDMAAGNLFGSNLFNMAMLGVDDVLYVRGPLLPAVDSAHAISAVAAIIMSGIAVIGLTMRAQRKRYRTSWDSLAIVATYVVGVALLYLSR